MATNRKRTAHRAATASRTVDHSKDVNVRVARRLWPFVMARADQMKKTGAWVVEQAVQAYLGLDDRSGIVDTPDLTQGAEHGRHEESHDAGGTGRDAATVAVHPSPADARTDSEVRSDSSRGKGIRDDGGPELGAGRGPGSGDPFGPGSGDDVQRVDRARGPEVAVAEPVVVIEQPPEVVNHPKHGIDSGVDPDLGF